MEMDNCLRELEAMMVSFASIPASIPFTSPLASPASTSTSTSISILSPLTAASSPPLTSPPISTPLTSPALPAVSLPTPLSPQLPADLPLALPSTPALIPHIPLQRKIKKLKQTSEIYKQVEIIVSGVDLGPYMPAPMGLGSSESDTSMMRYVKEEERLERLALGLGESEEVEGEVRWKKRRVTVDNE